MMVPDEWIKCAVSVKGNGSDDFIRRANENCENGFFEHFIPVPEIFKRFNTAGYTALDKDDHFRKQLKLGDSLLEVSSKETIPVTEEYLSEFAEAEEKMQTMYEAKDIYEWQKKHWGCYGDAYNFKFNNNRITFYSDTLIPKEGFKEISKQYPDMVISLKYSYDDGFSTDRVKGENVISNGKIIKGTLSVKGMTVEEYEKIIFKSHFENTLIDMIEEKNLRVADNVSA